MAKKREPKPKPQPKPFTPLPPFRWQAGDRLWLKARPKDGGPTVVLQVIAEEAGDRYSGKIPVRYEGRSIRVTAMNVFQIQRKEFL